MDNITISVIIPIWNGRKHLPACLDALLTQASPSLEIIAVDNGSTDSSAELVRERYPEVRLIENGRNLGFAGGCNVGLQAARGEHLVLVNQDVTVQAGWLEGMVKALALPEVGIAGCKLLYPDGTIQHAGGIINYPLAQPGHHGYREPDRGQWDEKRDVDYVTGASMALKREMLDKIGLFDEGFFPAFYEETDLCFRARAAGYRVVYTPQGTAVHQEASTMEREGVAYSRWMGRGRLRFVLKHYTAQQFHDDFVPADRAWLASLTDLDIRQGFRMAYLDTLLGLREIPRAGVLAQPGSEEAVAEALVDLRGVLTLPPAGRPRIASTPDLLVAPPWQPSARPVSKVPILGPAIARLLDLLSSVWRLQEKLAVVQEILVCLDREAVEGRRLQAEAMYRVEEEIRRLETRLDTTGTTTPQPEEGEQAPT